MGQAPDRIVQQLTRLRARGEEAKVVKLSHLLGHLLVLGRVAPDECHVGRLIIVTAPLESCDLGDVLVRWTAQQTALASSLSGWVACRVTQGKGVVTPDPDDVERARIRLSALGWDWRFAPYERGAA